MSILVTGAAGFIGFHTCERLIEQGPYLVTGVDNINDYYDPSLKRDRLRELGINPDELAPGRLVTSDKYPSFQFMQLSIEDKADVFRLFEEQNFDFVINLAAQAGVRYSLENPFAYLHSNLAGFLNILEACRQFIVKHLVYASSSSVYGLNQKIPFSIHDGTDHPVSLYAASKKSNELMAHTYSYLYRIPTTGLRFFTVYGPWGRPDMAYFSFTRDILEGRPIRIFNEGNMMRDFTYIDDIVSGVVACLSNIPDENPDWNRQSMDPATSSAPYRIYNLGNHKPVRLGEFVSTLEELLGRQAEKILMPMQPGDVESTYSDIEDSARDFGFQPSTDLKPGLTKFVDWYRSYYRV